MSGSDASIYSLIRQARPPENPIQQYGQVMQIRNMIDSGELHGLQRDKLRKEFADEESTAAAYRESGGDSTKLRDLLYGRGLYKPAIAAEKAGLERETARATLDKTKMEVLSKSLQMHRDQLAGVNDPQAAAQWVMAGFNDPNISRIAQKFGSPEEVISRIPQDPQGFAQWKMQNGLGIEKFLEQTKPDYKTVGAGGTTVVRQMNPQAPGFSAEPIAHTATPGDVMTDRRTRDEGAANRGVTMRGQNLIDARSRETTDAGRVPAGYRRTADGNLESIPGGPAQSREDKTSDTERTSAGYASRMGASGQIIDELEKKGVGKPGWMESAYRGMGAETAANTSQMLDPERQKYRQAQEDWVRAKLRKESGAVIASDEMDREIRVYFPMIGDSKEVVTQKASSRKVAERAMTQAAGRAPVEKPSSGGWKVERE